MANVTVFRRNEAVRNDGKAPLYVNLSLSGERVRIHLDIHVSLKEWDPQKQRIRGTSREVRDKNLIIANTVARINEILVETRLRGERLDKERFLFKYHNPGSGSSFIKYAFERLDRIRTAIEYETYRHHVTAIEKLRAYAPDLSFADIDQDWLRVYSAYLRKELGNAPGTIAKNLSIIRAHYMAGIRDGRTDRNPFEAYRMPRSEPRVTFLTEDELMDVCKAYKLHILQDPDHQAVQLWLFMAFTGMHISDVRELRIEQIYNDEIHYRRKKTKVAVSVPLSAPARELIKFYAGDRNNGFLMSDMPSDQWFNRRIKLAMAKIGINKNMSAKSARHTFATIFYRRTKDIGTLSSLLGHTSVRHTMVYTHIIHDARAEGMSTFDSFA